MRQCPDPRRPAGHADLLREAIDGGAGEQSDTSA